MKDTDYNWFDEYSEMPEGISPEKPRFLNLAPWQKESGFWSGGVSQPHFGDLKFYKFPPIKIDRGTITIFGKDLPLISNADVKWFKFSIKKGRGQSAFMIASNPYKGKILTELSLYEKNGFEDYARKFGKQMPQHIKDVIEYRRTKGKKGYIRIAPWWHPFGTRGYFETGNQCFVTLETWSDFCGLKKIGKVLKKAPFGAGPPPSCHPLALHIGVPKLPEFDIKKLLELGFLARVFWGDPALPPSTPQSRMFLLFGMTMIVFGEKTKERTRYAMQYLFSIEAPTAGCIEFPILREGTHLYRENVNKLMLKYPPTVIKFITQSMTAFQFLPDMPVVVGQSSYLPIVPVILRKDYREPEVEMGGNW